MFDPISLAVGGGLVGAGWVIGRLGRRPARQALPELQPPICGCGHDLALHDRADGRCHAEINRKGPVGLREWVRCNCRRYTGPTPLEDLLTPPTLPPT
ncbi:hypothetical protein [Nocardia pseudobrasiliensis]|uniref:Uncharacterized protein n=1 Tax=Nocardia pseudobrasiliensis TaxID=45979 RepID=A0A370IB63_9NOCA|nr:hypothetical protein [Nocardia pseudobrasiliensis]RDI67966.1 hypothetical protein DFR76_102367 [Nocardia pseudobrasiliensis]